MKYKRKSNQFEESEIFWNKTNNKNYIISDGNRLDSIIKDLRKELKSFGVAFIEIDDGSSDFLFKLEKLT